MGKTERKTKQAEQALDEAKQRYKEQDANFKNMPVEKKGRGGLEPTRYGDWEVKGIATDF